MTIELRYLAGAIVLGLVHVLLTGVLTTVQHGVAYGLGPRDECRPLVGRAARVERAFGNFMQTFPFFAAAVLMVQVLDRHGGLTEWGAALYFWARVAFVPLYVVGIPGPRSAVFVVSMTGIGLVLAGLA
jgi:uncharacterized MAPEG superfamily protein